VAVVLGLVKPLHVILNAVPVLVYAEVVNASEILIYIGFVETIVNEFEVLVTPLITY
jgi:hypothetical protein